MAWDRRWKRRVDVRGLCIREDNGEVFVAGALSHRGVAVLDVTTGRLEQARELSSGLNLGMPFALTADLLIVPLVNVGVVALDRRSIASEPVWQYPVGPGICGVSVSEGAVYVSRWDSAASPGSGGGLARLDAGTGQPMWDKPIGFVGTSPTVADGNVYVGLDGLGEWAASGADGTRLWNQTPPRRVINQGNATVHEDVVYFNDDDKPGTAAAVYALNAGDGAPRWTTRLDGEAPKTNLLLHQRRVYTATEWTLYALDIDNHGAEVWRVELGTARAWRPKWPGWLQVHDGWIHVHTEKGLRRFSVTNGKEKKPVKFSMQLQSYRIEGNSLYVALGSDTGGKQKVAAYDWVR
jgi:outer membrane protein assembly factor BamB